jgi:hypothetical protein
LLSPTRKRGNLPHPCLRRGLRDRFQLPRSIRCGCSAIIRKFAGATAPLLALRARTVPSIDGAVVKARGHLARKEFPAARQLLEETIARHPNDASRLVLSYSCRGRMRCNGAGSFL